MVNDKTDFTQGSILKKLVAFMMPVLGALILQAAYGASGSAGGRTIWFNIGAFRCIDRKSGIESGYICGNTARDGNYRIDRAVSGREATPEQIGSVIGGSAVVFAGISIVLFILMVGFAHPISVLMQAPEEAVTLTSSYVRICGSGIFFIVAYNVLSAIFRGMGDSKSPLLFVLVACIINIIGDLALLAGLHMDAAGAAIATVAAQDAVWYWRLSFF